jgi:hypothetical protein
MRCRVASLQPHLPDRHRVECRDWRAARMLFLGRPFHLSPSDHGFQAHAYAASTTRSEAPSTSLLHVPSEPFHPASDDTDQLTSPLDSVYLSTNPPNKDAGSLDTTSSLEKWISLSSHKRGASKNSPGAASAGG